VEVLKRSGSFRKDWGLLFGAFFLSHAINAAVGRRSFWWSGLIVAGCALVAAFLRRHWP
jgi:hypothetical protein